MLGQREYIVTFSVTHIGILEAMIVRFSMQREDIIEHTIGNCHVFII